MFLRKNSVGYKIKKTVFQEKLRTISSNAKVTDVMEVTGNIQVMKSSRPARSAVYSSDLDERNHHCSS